MIRSGSLEMTSTGLPTVSVLIPCYNAEKYIGETSKLVFQQTWPKIQVVVVDDGSTDRSAHVVQSFADQTSH